VLLCHGGTSPRLRHRWRRGPLRDDLVEPSALLVGVGHRCRCRDAPRCPRIELHNSPESARTRSGDQSGGAAWSPARRDQTRHHPRG
jgi:hypothetical protein